MATGGLTDHHPMRARGLHGAVTNIGDLMLLRGTARYLAWRSRVQIRKQQAGARKARMHGRGMDFAQVRPYTPGDDVRHIDWRVTARSGKPHTKMFTEEQEKPVLILIDLGASTFFGTRRRSKSLAAIELATLLIWHFFDNWDRVGAIINSLDGQHVFRPRRSRRTVLRVLNQLTDSSRTLADRVTTRSALPCHLQDLFVCTRRVAKPGTSIFIISDFSDPGSLVPGSLAQRNLQLLSRHCYISSILVSDPFERELPAPGTYPVQDGGTWKWMDTRRKSLRAAWRNQQQAKTQLLRELMHSCHGQLITAGTEDDLHEAAQQLMQS